MDEDERQEILMCLQSGVLENDLKLCRMIQKGYDDKLKNDVKFQKLKKAAYDKVGFEYDET